MGASSVSKCGVITPRFWTVSALDSYNESLQRARDLADNIAAATREAVDARSDKWQDSDKGDQVRHWIEQWEMNLDEVDLDFPAVRGARRAA